MRSRTRLVLTGAAAGVLLVPAAEAATPARAPLPGGGDAIAPLLHIAKLPLVRHDVRLAHRLAAVRGAKLRRGYRATITAWPAARIERHTATLRRKLRRARRAQAARSTASPALQAIAACESGGNPRADTGNGFYGKYQFTLQTWQAIGGSGNPAQASEAEQDRRAARLLATAGAAQWPVCG
jgi:hypothetical protein